MRKIQSKIAAWVGLVALVYGVLGVWSFAQAGQAGPKRFVDNGNGTISDNQTGLMWEKKTGSVGTLITCSTPTTCADPSNVNNLYLWSDTGSAADGGLFTDFLAKINCTISSSGACGAGPFSDWRVPTLAELRTILAAEFPNCLASPCIDPIFGPTQASSYWSSTTFVSIPDGAWNVDFTLGFVVVVNKGNDFFARAVRGGR